MIKLRKQNFQIIRLSPEEPDSNKPLSKASIEAFTRLAEVLKSIKKQMHEDGTFDTAPRELTAYDYHDGPYSKNHKRRLQRLPSALHSKEYR